MASWAGTIVGMIGFRSVQTGGVTSLIRPSRVPLGAFVSASSSNPARTATSSRQRSNLMCFPDVSPPSKMEFRRTFWNWRGGDDKRWAYEEAASPLRGGNGTTAQGTSSREPSDSSTEGTPTRYPLSYPVSVCSIQGIRTHMEDEFFVSMDGDFAAVFDGHGGPAVSRYLRKNLYAIVQGVLPLITPPTTSRLEDELQDDDKTAWTTTGSAQGLSKQSNTRTSTTTSEAHGAESQSPSSPTLDDYQTALESALEKVDREVQRISHWSYQGSTAVVIWIHEDRRPGEQSLGGSSSSDQSLNINEATSSGTTTGQRTIIAANIGDSRAVLCRNHTAWDLTRDHKPDEPSERERIEKSGGKVVWCGKRSKDGEPIWDQGIYRVNRNLALSRAIGDRSERPHVTADPEIITVPLLEDEDEFIIVATDGLWDVMESNEAVDLVQRLVQQGLPREQVATWLVEESTRRFTYDNVTVVIIWLDRAAASKST